MFKFTGPIVSWSFLCPCYRSDIIRPTLAQFATNRIRIDFYVLLRILNQVVQLVNDTNLYRNYSSSNEINIKFKKTAIPVITELPAQLLTWQFDVVDIYDDAMKLI